MANVRPIVRAFSWCVFLVLVSGLLNAEEPLTRFDCGERLGIDWPETMVTYRVRFRPGEVRNSNVRLVDADGQVRPCQLWRIEHHADGSVARARISFMAELPADGKYEFRLLPGTPAPSADPQLRASTDAGRLTLQNSTLAIRLPAPGEAEFAEPLRFGGEHAEMLELFGRQAEVGIAPGPIDGIRLADGRFVGGSYLQADDPEQASAVTALTCRVTEQGPLFVEAVVRYTFAGGGFYQLTARLQANDPAGRIDEQMDLGATFPPKQSLRMVLSLNGGARGGFRPDRVFWCATRGMSERDAAFDQLLTRQGFDTEPFQAANFGHRVLSYDRPSAKLFDLLAWYPWHPAAHYFGLVDSRSLAADPKAPLLAVVPLHAGTWRGMHQWFQLPQQFAEVRSHGDGDVCLRWPLLAQPHPNTLLHTGEFDPELPLTFRRRVWALVAGPMQYHQTLLPLRQHEGHVTLDNYKDWVLNWPARSNVTHPRLVLNREDTGRLASRLNSLPESDTLEQYLYFQDDPVRREKLWQGLSGPSCWSGPWGQVREALHKGGDNRALTWVAHYRHTQMAGWVNEADELLSSPQLDPERRRRLRTALAALASALAEPDFNPRGSMVHLGNPNMPINRFCALPLAAALIPDHPHADRYLDLSADYLRYKLAMNVAPGGAWSELITYFGASAPHVMQTAMVLGNSGRLDEPTLRQAALPAAFTVNLLSPPDPRFGKRMLPNWGHEGYDLTTHWLVAAGLIRKTDPELAKALAWSWDQLGRPLKSHHDAGFTPRALVHADLLRQLPAGYVPRQLSSTWWPGFGAVLRAHAGDPHETYFSYRQGYLTSHCDANQGDFVLYAKGAPLSTLSLFGYAIHNNRPFGQLNEEFGWHNRVRFGSQSNTGGWPGGGAISGVHGHFFSDSVDYLIGLGDYGPQRWSRQILFLKGKAAAGPNYFVFRDSFCNQQGDPPKLQRKWWYLKTPGKKELVRSTDHELNYSSPHGPRLNVRFLQPADVQVESRDATQDGPLYNRAAINWQEASTKSPTDPPKTSVQVEETITVTAVGPIAPGQDILATLYPQRADERAPRYEPLADGAARITTSEGVDYVFARRTPMQFQQGEVAFEGTAGAVRIYPNEIHLVVAESPGRVAHRGVTFESDVPGVRVIPAGQTQREQRIRQPAPPTSIRIAFDPNAGPMEELAAGVHKQQLVDGVAYRFDSPETIHFDRDGVEFLGRRGAVAVDKAAKTTRLVIIDGWQIGHGGHTARQWTAGPVDATFHADRIVGRTSGQGRFVHLSRPSGLDRLAVLSIDGQNYAPGTNGPALIIPVLPGEHEWEVEPLSQPPIFRTWQQW
jgi:hypothetical protein